MTFSREDRAAIGRLTDAVNALTAAIKEGSKQLKAQTRVEMQRIQVLTELLEAKRVKQPARKKAR